MKVLEAASKKVFRLVIVAAIALAVSANFASIVAPPAQAADHSIDIKNFAFTPSSITISSGDSVTWTNDDTTTHTVTGTDWGSGDLAPGATFTHTFAANGSYAYHCSIHPFMTGTVVVGGSSSPPPTSTPHKTLLPAALLAVLIAVAVIVVVALIAVLMLKGRSKKS